MKEKLMSEGAQFKLVEAVKLAAIDHAMGTGATEAIVKQAEAIGANPHVLKLMTDAFNTSKYLAHHKMATDTERANTIDLADFDEAKDAMFPSGGQAKAAASVTVLPGQIPNYLSKMACAGPGNSGMSAMSQLDSGKKKKPYAKKKAFDDMSEEAEAEFVAKIAEEVGHDVHLFKKANDLPQAFDIKLRKAFAAVDYYRKQAEVTHNQAAECSKHAQDLSGMLADHFRSPNNIPSWGKFAEEIGHVHGEEGIRLAGVWMHTHKIAGLLKRHGYKQASSIEEGQLVDDQTAPHQAFLAMKEALSTEAGLRKVAEQRMAKYLSEKAQLLGKSKEAADKEATVVGSIFAYSGLMNALTKATKNALEPGVPKPELPPHRGLEGQLRQARVGGVVRDMMDEDDVISRHASENPASVTQTINELIQVNPALLDMPVALRSAVRRQLEMGTSEPHEIQQVNELHAPIPLAGGTL